MNPQILTLFGEVYEPAPAKKRAGKKNVEAGESKRRRSIDAYTNVLEGWKPEKHYYSIGEVALLFRVANSNIRFWTNEFGLKVRTTTKGDRLYSPEHIEELHLIYNLVKQRGYTIAGAKVKLKEEKKKLADALHLERSLSKLRNQLAAIRQQLD